MSNKLVITSSDLPRYGYTAPTFEKDDTSPEMSRTSAGEGHKSRSFQFGVHFELFTGLGRTDAKELQMLVLSCTAGSAQAIKANLLLGADYYSPSRRDPSAFPKRTKVVVDPLVLGANGVDGVLMSMYQYDTFALDPSPTSKRADVVNFVTMPPIAWAAEALGAYPYADNLRRLFDVTSEIDKAVSEVKYGSASSKRRPFPEIDDDVYRTIWNDHSDTPDIGLWKVSGFNWMWNFCRYRTGQYREGDDLAGEVVSTLKHCTHHAVYCAGIAPMFCAMLNNRVSSPYLNDPFFQWLLTYFIHRADAAQYGRPPHVLGLCRPQIFRAHRENIEREINTVTSSYLKVTT